MAIIATTDSNSTRVKPLARLLAQLPVSNVVIGGILRGIAARAPDIKGGDIVTAREPVKIRISVGVAKNHG
jgi:hypothetical protein